MARLECQKRLGYYPAHPIAIDALVQHLFRNPLTDLSPVWGDAYKGRYSRRQRARLRNLAAMTEGARLATRLFWGG